LSRNLSLSRKKSAKIFHPGINYLSLRIKYDSATCRSIIGCCTVFDKSL
jgi:hypothetical protein